MPFIFTLNSVMIKYNLDAIVNNDHPSNMKDVTLTQYKTDNNAKQWISLYTAFASLKNWTEGVGLKTFPFYLEGNVQWWFHSLSEEIRTSWLAVTKAFVDNYSLSKQEKCDKLQSLLRCEQLPHESVSEYQSDMERECNNIGRSEEQQIEMSLQPT
jgi:hypothetical protein